MATKHISRHCQMCPGGQFIPAQNRCYKATPTCFVRWPAGFPWAQCFIEDENWGNQTDQQCGILFMKVSLVVFRGCGRRRIGFIRQGQIAWTPERKVTLNAEGIFNCCLFVWSPSTALLLSFCQDCPPEGEPVSFLHSLCRRARVAGATRRAKTRENAAREGKMKKGDVTHATESLSLMVK